MRIAILVGLLINQMVYAEGPKVVTAYESGQAYHLNVVKVPGKDMLGNPIYLEEKAAEDYKELMVAAAKAGFFLQVNYGFRTYRQQRYLHNAMPEKASRPGWSTHQKGISIDVAGCFKDLEIDGKIERRNTILYWWLKRHGPQHGFINDIRSEPWHWTYVREEAVGG